LVSVQFPCLRRSDGQPGQHRAELIRISKLKEEDKILATLTSEQAQRLIEFKPRGKYQQRIHVLSCLVLDTGLRIDEALSLRRDNVDFDNLLLHVNRIRWHRIGRIIPLGQPA
jgi:integrase